MVYCVIISSDIGIDLNIIRLTYKLHEYDFYKPYLNSYPVVNEHVSFDSCYNKYIKKSNKNENRNIKNNYWIFHVLYNKLVTKTFETS